MFLHLLTTALAAAPLHPAAAGAEQGGGVAPTLTTIQTTSTPTLEVLRLLEHCLSKQLEFI